MEQAKIILNNVSKKFFIGHKKNLGLLARILSSFSGREPKRIINVLKDVSLQINSGEITGIIGDNGSGKSTLLRIIAGIYNEDSGEVIVRGRIVSLINLYAGLKERLTMRENIFLVGSLFGLSQNEVKKKFDSIVKFSELANFLDTKIYQFSEGMKQRLSFSIAVHCEPEILLLDEVFEIGDEEFKEKSTDRIKEFARKGSSVVLVSHNMDLIRKYCDRIIWLNKGKIIRSGTNHKIIEEYLE